MLLGADSLPWRKPDPRHLFETIARAGGEPGRAVLVGGHGDRPGCGAGGGGCPACWWASGRRGEAVAGLEPPAAVVGHYDELPEVLERLLPK